VSRLLGAPLEAGHGGAAILERLDPSRHLVAQPRQGVDGEIVLRNGLVLSVDLGASEPGGLVGYRAQKQGQRLALQIGFSHPGDLDPPAGITLDAPQPNRIVVTGIDKELVGQTAAGIRALRKPDPYKGKGIRYVGERVRRKAGKAGKAAAGAGAASGGSKA